MKALSLTQPWATLVIQGRKRFETRGWPTYHRGQIAIHASKGMPAYAKEAAREFGLEPDALPRGVILGTVHLVGVAPTADVKKALQWAEDHLELAYGDYDEGRWAWQLVMPREFAEPIPARGALGLWEWEAPEHLIHGQIKSIVRHLPEPSKTIIEVMHDD